MKEPTIAQNHPKGAYLARKAEIDGAVGRVFESGSYVLGREVRAFETEFAAFVGALHGVGVASGTDAIELSLKALGLRPGDAVYTVSHTAIATVAAIERAGLVPVLVDVESASYTLDPGRLEEALRSPPAGVRPRAIVVVHLYGHPGDMAAILEIARHHSLRVVEDCSQSHGATLCGRTTGTFGDLGAFSFYPTKNLGAFGDGGMVVTSDFDLSESVRRLREYGWGPGRVSVTPGVNSRLDELQAAALRVCLVGLPEHNRRRREIAAQYDRSLEGSALTLPVAREGVVHAYHQYVCRTPHRDALREHLRARGIETAIHYPCPVHLEPGYSGRILRHSLEVTERLRTVIVSLPMHPWLSDPDVARVAREVLALART